LAVIVLIMQKPNIGRILELLINSYGDRAPDKRLEPAAELVQTILSQNTSDTNSRHAFKSLLDTLAGWDKVAEADTVQIADAIRAGGLADIKAKYIKSALQSLQKVTPDFNLMFLKDMGVVEAREWLVQLPGVGMKTASCVLLFSLGMSAFPVDTHVFRVAKRLGLITAKIPVDAAHIELEKQTRPADIYRCHVLLIEHGRKTCKAQRPLCHNCALAAICPGYKQFT